jgi:hypothetical protein
MSDKEQDPLCLHEHPPMGRRQRAPQYAPQVIAYRERLTSSAYADSMEVKLALVCNMIFLIYQDLKQGQTHESA